ncbi:MAG TPA: hypothetical protein DDW49_10440 [Deltaproteobacteria bacterium]|nr:MAG: hypothetical protein A2048_05905 [Deltaproteobacteria bacterium GWA2_45_12]HBF13780.1 hypothetical protein [Deltaproteobacteria bacterium]
MLKKDIDNFFKQLNLELKHPIVVYLTGGVASCFLGGVRPTQDIDCAIKGSSHWSEIDSAVKNVSRQTGIACEYAEDISRWGMVGYTRFEKNAKFYKKFGKISVSILEPTIWSVGKINRYTIDDVLDVEAVFKKQKISAKKAVEMWGAAFNESPPSTEKGMFAKRVFHFLANSGGKIWGAKFDAKNFNLLFSKKIHLKAAP